MNQSLQAKVLDHDWFYLNPMKLFSEVLSNPM